MATHTVIPNSNVLLSDIRDTLNANGSSCTNVIKTFFLSANAAINHWAFRKPYSTNLNTFKLTDAQIRSINCGLVPKQIAAYTSLPSVMDGGMNGWTYTRPTGATNSPFRVGDYVGYFTKAEPMIRDFCIADKISLTSTKAIASAIVNLQDGVQVSLADIGGLSSYKPAIYLVKGTAQRMYSGAKTIGESGVFDIEFITSELSTGNWTAYPFLIGGPTNSTYYTIPNVSPKAFEVVRSLDALGIQAQYRYAVGTTNIVAVQYKFSLTNNSGGSVTNNRVYLTNAKNDITVETSKGEYGTALPNLTVASNITYNYPKDYNGMDWAEISVSNFNPSYVNYVVISIGSARLVASVNILQAVSPQSL